ncbi:hypothetical protein KIW84_070203, partial [Lathyrus oleraceus]
GAIVLLGVGALLFIKFWKRPDNDWRKSRSRHEIMVDHKYQWDENVMNASVAGGGGGGGEGGGALSPTGNMVISIQVLRQVTYNFRKENIIGKGGFGTVYKGELHDGTQIAVKRMQSGITDETKPNEFTSEIAVLTKVRHKHLVALLGYCLDGNERLLVYEYMPQGALSKHLFNCK